MVALSVLGTIFFILLFAVVPKLFRAQVRGNTMATALGALAAVYVLIYRDVDEDRVQQAVADTANDG